jgi:hypothetical protein
MGISISHSFFVKKKQGVPWIAFRFRHGFRLRLSTEREI